MLRWSIHLALLAACGSAEQSTTARAGDVSSSPGTPIVAVGAYHSCVAKGGRVWCWGANDGGQLGDGTAEASAAPRRVVGLDGVVEIDAAGTYTCARSGAGVHCWGRLTDERTAFGPIPSYAEPVFTPWPRPKRIEIERDVVAIDVGLGHACAVSGDGRAWCWGMNAVGQLGDGTLRPSLEPVEVATRERFTDIVLAYTGSCARTEDGRWFCWGRWPHDWLRSPRAASNSRTPIEAPAIRGHALSFARHGCGARASERVRCSQGLSFDGGDVREIAVGDSSEGASACVRRGDGVVLCAGRNDYGQAAVPRPRIVERPVIVRELEGAVSIAMGPMHGCAGFRDGSVACWGGNSAGQRGIGVFGEIDVRPRRVRFRGDTTEEAAESCMLSGSRVCRLDEIAGSVRVCYCAFVRPELPITHPTRCWRVDGGRVQPTPPPASNDAPATAAPDDGGATVRATASGVSVCDPGGACRTVPLPRPAMLLRTGDPPAIEAAATADGAFVTVGRIRAPVTDIREVGRVAAIDAETYAVDTGRRVARFRLSSALPIDPQAGPPVFVAAGALLEVHYVGVTLGTELRNPRTGAVLRERGLIDGRVRAGDDLWVYLLPRGRTLWIREDGSMVAETGALPLTASTDLLEPGAWGLRSRDDVIVATAGRVRVFDAATAALEHDLTLPWCRPANAPRGEGVPRRMSP